MARPRGRILPALALLLCAASGPAPAVAADAGLRDQRGAAVTWEGLAAGPRLLYFGYTFCPDVCPTALSDMTRALEALGKTADALTPIFVSVDPGRDSPEVLADYLAYFDPRFVGVTGDPAAVDALAARYGIVVERRPPDADGDYVVDHGATVLLLDAGGTVRARFPQGAPPERIAAGIARLLASK